MKILKSPFYALCFLFLLLLLVTGCIQEKKTPPGAKELPERDLKDVEHASLEALASFMEEVSKDTLGIPTKVLLEGLAPSDYSLEKPLAEPWRNLRALVLLSHPQRTYLVQNGKVLSISYEDPVPGLSLDVLAKDFPEKDPGFFVTDQGLLALPLQEDKLLLFHPHKEDSTMVSSITFTTKAQLDQERADKRILKQLSTMTIEEKVGQLVISGLGGQGITEETLALATTHHLGGFILNGHNLPSPDVALDTLNALKAENKPYDIPLFLAIDQEGGRVAKFPGLSRRLPSSLSVGTFDQEDFSRAYGKLLGDLITSLGFNVNFAPVLDIHSNEQNPVIGDRAYGRTKEAVILHGLAVLEGLREAQVIPSVKHFPGHGDTSVDSHVALPHVAKSLDELLALELVPFVEAIRKDAEMIMVAHLFMASIDDLYPSSLSEKVMTTLLRETLGYDGVILTDDLAMAAITNSYGLVEASLKSFYAGADLLLLAKDEGSTKLVLEALLQEVASGNLKEARIDESVYRILRLKDQYHLQDSLLPMPSYEALNASIDEVFSRFHFPR